MIPPGATAIVGAAESTEIGTVPDMSSVGLAVDAAANAMMDAGITAADIDGFTCGYFPVADMSRQLGIFPSGPTTQSSGAVLGCFNYVTR
ncbi:MAG: hypothetical protein Ct9H300mP26_3180 [Acidimicrobiales bacterium]|nr:MAG: hypothetical protein Ct9H300mP26_3180 [Acidimicrobiales bacterium]